MAIKGKNKVKRLAQSLGTTPKEAKDFGDQVNRILGQLGLDAATFEDISKTAVTFFAPDRTPENVAKALRSSPAEGTGAPAGAAAIPTLQEDRSLPNSNQTQSPPSENLPQDVFVDAVPMNAGIIANRVQTGLPEDEVMKRANASSQHSSPRPISRTSSYFDDWEEAKANSQGYTLYPKLEPEFGPRPTENRWNSPIQSGQQSKNSSRLNSSLSDGQASWWYQQQKKASPDTGMRIVETHVAGVTFEGRQVTVARLMVGEKLWLHREPHNPYDRNAILVARNNGAQVGYVPRDEAAVVAPALDRVGQPVQAEITAVLGRDYPGQNLGVRIRFVVPEDAPVNLPSFDEIERKFDM